MNLLLGFLYLLNFLCILFLVFVEEKRPQATIAWIIVITAIPFLGVVLYIFLGDSVIPTLSRQGRRHYKQFNYYWESFEKYLLYNKWELSKDINPITRKYSDLILLNMNLNNSLYSNDNTVSIFTSAKEKYQALFKDIKNAKETINIEYFIIRNDEIGKEFISLLTQKAKEGVTINLIYDELGSFHTTKRLFLPLIEAGGTVCRFYTTIFSNLMRINNRNHRKIVVIDGRIGYTGGMNIGKEYLGLGEIPNWKDMHIRFEGSAVYSLQVNFLLDFISSHKKEIETIEDQEYNKYFPSHPFSGKVGMQIVSSGPDSRNEAVKNGYVKMIYSAEKTILMQTPYLVPDETLLSAIKLAASSGVTVKLMLPGVPDKDYVYFISMSYVEELLKCGVEVYFYKGFLHSKMLAIDGNVCSVGTTNFDTRSFQLNYEVNAFIYDQEITAQCEKAFADDICHARKMDLDTFARRKPLRKILERIFRLFSPIA